jgi:hypothetical protein
MSKDLLPSEDLFPFPLALIREGVDGRRRKSGRMPGTSTLPPVLEHRR